MKVFIGLDGSGTDKKLGYVPYVLISGAILWNGKRFRNLYPSAYKELFLDSGGFSFFTRYAEYPYSIEQYVELSKKLNATYTAVLDYPCEPDVVRDDLNTNYKRIDKTIQNTEKCIEYEEVNWVAVVQGYTHKEYLYCCDLIKNMGLVTDLMAIGTLCVRKRVREIRNIIKLVRREFPETKLHGFGINLNMLKDAYIYENLYSIDTQAWSWNSERQKPGIQRNILPKCGADKLKNLKKFILKLERIERMWKYQKKLEDFYV